MNTSVHLLLFSFAMSPQMRLEVEICIKHSWTVRTPESFHATVDLHMLVEIGPLSETESTVGDGARVRSFVGVDPQVIKEVVPFSEMLATVVMVTFQNFDISF